MMFERSGRGGGITSLSGSLLRVVPQYLNLVRNSAYSIFREIRPSPVHLHSEAVVAAVRLRDYVKIPASRWLVGLRSFCF